MTSFITKATQMTKRMRKLLKAARIEYRKAQVRDKVRHVKQTELCSTCNSLNCICKDNERSSKLIRFYQNVSVHN